MKKITLPSGATATLKDPSLLRVGDRKRIIKSADVEGGDLTRAMALQDALIAILVEDWSYDLIIPSVRIDSIDELQTGDYDALVEHTQDAQQFLFPTLTPTKENEQNPKAPTADFSA